MQVASVVLATLALAYGSPVPRGVPGGVLSMPLTKVHVANGTLARRGDVLEPFANYRSWLYLGTVGFGTPAQSFQEVIDTGSSDLWTYSSTAQAGGFDSSRSSTYRLQQSGGYSMNYVIGSAKGDLASDTITISGVQLPSQQIGVVNSAEQQTQWGTIGVGMTSNEENRGPNGSYNYPNVPAALKAGGYIQRNLYSLYLNSLTAASGEILFGGIDTAKYEGQLNQVPFTSSQMFQVEAEIYGVTMYGVMDSGTSALDVPTAAYEAALVNIKAAIPNLRYDSPDDLYYVTDISQVPADQSLPVSIGGVTYQVPYQDLFEQTGNGNPYWYMLFFDTNVKSDGNVWLGDAFLRSVYVVYDLDGGVAGIAQAKYTDDSNVVAVGPDGIPASLLA